MKLKTYLTTVSIIFLLLGVAHLYRAFNNVPVMFGDTDVVVWLSWVVAAVSLYLAYHGHKLSK